MANPEHVAVVQEGGAAIDRWWRSRLDKYQFLDLSGVDLSGVHLPSCNLTAADFRGANLARADLTLANLTLANLMVANLTGAKLAGARLTRTNLGGARLGLTAIGACSMAECVGLDAVKHERPSSIGTDTLTMTLRDSGGRFTEEQLLFFVGAGVPELLLDYLPSLVESNPLQFYSCFISYSTPVEKFAERLHSDLGAARIKCWKWNVDAVPGRDLRENIDRAIWNYDKMVLVCSEPSLMSGPVQREVERAIQKEDRLVAAKADAERRAKAAGATRPYVDTDVLVPVRLDSYVLEGWQHHQKPDVVRRYIPDFSGWETDQEKYQRELQRLIQALNPAAWPPRAPR